MTQREQRPWADPAATALIAEVDWDHPSLAHLQCRTLHDQGRTVEAATALVRHLRERETPRMEYNTAYVTELRRAASDADRAGALKRFEQALQTGMGDKRRSGSLMTMRATDLQLVDQTPLFETMAAAFVARMEEQDKGWPQLEWGTVNDSFSTLLAALWPVAECPDAALMPLLACAARQTRKEWAESREWDDGVLGTASHNWWMSPFTGVFIIATCFPELKGLAPLRDLAPTTLERCILLLFHEDGFSREQSAYHFLSVQDAVRWSHVAELNGIEISEAARDRLKAAVQTYWKLLAPDGDVPHFGDGYRGALQPAQPLRDGLRFRELAAWFGIGEVKYVDRLRCPDWQPPMKNMLPMIGRNLLPLYQALKPVVPPLDTALHQTQWYIMRSDWGSKADWAALDAAPRGKAVTSHAHNALLHLVLYSRGRPILLDNGAGPYGDTPQRRWRLSSAAHNVAMVDEEDHLARPRGAIGEWRFHNEVNPLVDTWITQPGYAYWSASHEGYGRLPLEHRVTYCRRKLFYLRGRYWILIDRFNRDYWVRLKQTTHTYDQHFHLPPPVQLGENGRAWTISETDEQAGNLLIVPVPGLCGQATVEPCPYPLEGGYDNPDHLRYRLISDQEVLLATLLIPYQGNSPPRVAVETVDVQLPDGIVAPHEITGLRISIDGETHLYVEQHKQWTQRWQADGCQSVARVFHSAVPT